MSRAIDLYRAQMVEADMRQTLFDAVDALGGVHSWIRDSRALDVVGSPDLELVVPPILYRLELKRLTGKPSPAQIRWLSLLGRCDTLVSGIVRPLPVGGDYGLGDILELLGGRQ
jgi:hypothetical protein